MVEHTQADFFGCASAGSDHVDHSLPLNRVVEKLVGHVEQEHILDNGVSVSSLFWLLLGRAAGGGVLLVVHRCCYWLWWYNTS